MGGPGPGRAAPAALEALSAPAGTRSAELFARANEVLVGGVNSPVRAMRSIGRDPVFIQCAAGPYVWDVDGTRYVDYLSTWGPAILGHAPDAVVRAVERALPLGTSFGAPTEREVRFAEAVCEAVPSVERLRMTSSGSEAVMGALRLARAATGRDVIVKVAGGYHGAVDGLLAEAGSGLTTLGVPSSPGVTAAATAATRIVPYNDAAAAAAALDGAAAMIVEPVAGNMGVVPPADGYLRALREACDRAGALLILDEVITGFRVARGGAQERYGVRADITCFGKIIGGGLPVGAFGGRADVMRELAPEGPCYQAGTLSGNPLATAAGLAVLGELAADGVYERLEAGGAALEEAIVASGAPVTINRVGSMLTPFFADGPVRDYASATAADTDRYARFARVLLAEGVYPPPSQFEAWFTGLTHGEEELRHTREALARAAEA
ncbi:glutamate-1-semialdehyde 2,1-aminomutase [Miltoncostaea marina]|uniref:glutamate-1-semialdehyde 2,1-aminomutase n=1 Tax=Miltoncostaea marina TaxID=2843215 RepID=UPI002484AAD8|nr:glutamate-1-semialdehyde 2,1-aminomutase [Miltoncostaea marina]